MTTENNGSSSGRDSRGKFVKGNRLARNGGRKKAEFRFQDILDDVVNERDWRTIIWKALQQAEEGDAKAREWLTERRWGKTVQSIEHMGEGGGPVLLNVIRNTPGQGVMDEPSS